MQCEVVADLTKLGVYLEVSVAMGSSGELGKTSPDGWMHRRRKRGI